VVPLTGAVLLGKLNGVYDVTANHGFVSIGITSDTAEFTVQSIRCRLERVGRQRYPNAREAAVTADWGGSNGARVRLCKLELQKLTTMIAAGLIYFVWSQHVLDNPDLVIFGKPTTSSRLRDRNQNRVEACPFSCKEATESAARGGEAPAGPALRRLHTFEVHQTRDA
jgi:hypothetical protein